MKKCRECGIQKPISEFRQSSNILKDGTRSANRRALCLPCDRIKIAAWMYKHTRGISHEERDDLLARQGGECAVCGSTDSGSKKGWHVDHCHTTQVIRGVLCATCNIALGMVGDSVDKLNLLTQYLLRHQQQGATTRA